MHRNMPAFVLSFSASLAIATLSGTAHADVLRVDASASGAGTGASWDDAYTDLSEALWAAQAGDEVWIAEGVYRPTRSASTVDPWQQTGDDRDGFFWIKRRVRVIGGFRGDETSVEQRAGSAASTILDGDLGEQGDPSDNARLLVFYTSEHSDTPGGPQNGNQFTAGGLESVTIRNAVGSGGMAVRETQTTQGVNLVLRDVRFINNHAVGTAGGGGLTWTGQAVFDSRMTGCLFEGNTAAVNGGGMVFDANANFLEIANTVFRGNAAEGKGGALFTEITLVANSSSRETIQNCVFDDNHAGGEGGAYWIRGFGGPDVVSIFNTVFSNNTAGTDGGAIWVYGGQTLPQQVGVATIEGTKIRAASNTFYNNRAGAQGSGGAIFLGSSEQTSGVANVSNSIFWGNQAGTDPVATPTAVIDFSIVGTPWSGLGGIAVSHTDPLFVNEDAGDFRLASASPAIDAGATLFGIGYDYFDFDGDFDRTEDLPFDLAGGPRRFDAWNADIANPFSQGPVVDLGAFESRAECFSDINGDGRLDLDDIVLFVSSFGAGDPRADATGEGVFDANDLTLFIERFLACAQ